MTDISNLQEFVGNQVINYLEPKIKLEVAILKGYQRFAYQQSAPCGAVNCTNIVYYTQPDGGNWRMCDYDDTVHLLAASTIDGVPLTNREQYGSVCAAKSWTECFEINVFCSNSCAERFRFSTEAYDDDDSDKWVCSKHLSLCLDCDEPLKKWSGCWACDRNVCENCMTTLMANDQHDVGSFCKLCWCSVCEVELNGDTGCQECLEKCA